MRNLILFIAVLVSSFSFSQSFDFACDPPLDEARNVHAEGSILNGGRGHGLTYTVYREIVGGVSTFTFSLGGQELIFSSTNRTGSGNNGFFFRSYDSEAPFIGYSVIAVDPGVASDNHPGGIIGGYVPARLCYDANLGGCQVGHWRVIADAFIKEDVFNTLDDVSLDNVIEITISDQLLNKVTDNSVVTFNDANLATNLNIGDTFVLSYKSNQNLLDVMFLVTEINGNSVVTSTRIPGCISAQGVCFRGAGPGTFLATVTRG